MTHSECHGSLDARHSDATSHTRHHCRWHSWSDSNSVTNTNRRKVLDATTIPRTIPSVIASKLLQKCWTVSALLLQCSDSSLAFSVLPALVPRQSTATTASSSSSSRTPIHRPGSSSTRLPMVFDFFRERTREGMDQLQNLQTAAATGQWSQGLAAAAAYTTQTNQAFATGLQKSRARLLTDLETLLTGVSPEDVLDELQDILLQADLGTVTAEEIVQEVQSLRDDSTFRLSKNDLTSIMRGKLLEALATVESTTAGSSSSRAIRFQTPCDDATSTQHHIPTVLFVMGANGMGKTTTIGKLAHRLRTEGNQTVLLAACDTFRAGAVEQLQQWADRANVSMVGPTEKATTPSAVLYLALDQGISNKVDSLIVDTSGRLSNNDALTQELAKMKRVIQKRLSVATGVDGQPVPNTNVPHETLLVLDASQGRVALDSAKTWHESIGLTGLILTKLDGSARGGSVVAVSRDLKLPVKLIGVGEGIDDLRDFDPESFVDGLLGVGVSGSGRNSGAASGEGAILVARLAEMRRERDLRAKSVVSQPPLANATQPINVPVAAGQSEMPLPGKPNRSSKSKKKKPKK